MLKVGLCSVTFRQLSSEEVIHVTKQAGLQGIEWGGDIHVPPGDIDYASEVAKRTEQAGLEVTSYGSYYRMGHENDGDSFHEVLKTAAALKAPFIRVWAGKYGSDEADADYRRQVVKDARRIADMAENENTSIHLEYHGGTLTDTEVSTERLLKDINHSNVYTYWQPAVGISVEERLSSIDRLKPWLSYVHVFHWRKTDRLPFSEGMSDWVKYVNRLKDEEVERYLLMEFVKDDDVDQFYKDAEVLKSLIFET